MNDEIRNAGLERLYESSQAPAAKLAATCFSFVDAREKASISTVRNS
jgi:hypothetical protein